MKNAFLVARHSFLSNVRNRFFVLCVVFCVVLVYAGTLLGMLAQEQRIRILLDLGLALIEMMCLAVAVYSAATSLLSEIEAKTVYLALTRPVGRSQYLLGRFFGLMASVLAAMAVMAAFHLVLLFSKGWSWDAGYLAALAGSFLAVFIIASLALFLSLFFSSTLTALVIASILWTLGHFIPEIRFLASRISGAESVILKSISYLIPNLEFMNWRDNPLSFTSSSLGLWGAYAAFYSGIWLAAASRLFTRREF